MKLLRRLGIALALLVPVTALASPGLRGAISCCPGECCEHGCPFCD